MDKRILIVDDCAPIRGLIREFIELRPGIKVCGEAADGFEGVEKGLELKPDAIILDFSMPRMNGLQAALMLHQVSPDTPLILFTIFNDAVMDRLAHNVGVASVISKSDQLTRLADEVQRLTTPLN
ncbi:MAG TPA: response regulator transcription factor [Candidatus Acidoferrales bacterium]|nr:response regulator transcription factor [Candidatus Acidoferrales bacterium]